MKSCITPPLKNSDYDRVRHERVNPPSSRTEYAIGLMMPKTPMVLIKRRITIEGGKNRLGTVSIQ